MTKDQINEFEISMLEFVKRAASEEATAAEVEALPAVARVFLDAIMNLP